MLVELHHGRHISGLCVCISRDERMCADAAVVDVAARAVRGEEAAAYAENDESFALIGETRRRSRGVV